MAHSVLPYDRVIGGWMGVSRIRRELQPPEPDFQTYLTRDLPHWVVETTEVLRPDYRRGDFHREAARRGQKIHHIPDPHPEPWSSFLYVLREKLAKPYAARSSLLIYHDMTTSDFPNYYQLHDRLFSPAR